MGGFSLPLWFNLCSALEKRRNPLLSWSLFFKWIICPFLSKLGIVCSCSIDSWLEPNTKEFVWLNLTKIFLGVYPYLYHILMTLFMVRWHYYFSRTSFYYHRMQFRLLTSTKTRTISNHLKPNRMTIYISFPNRPTKDLTSYRTF